MFVFKTPRLQRPRFKANKPVHSVLNIENNHNHDTCTYILLHFLLFYFVDECINVPSHQSRMRLRIEPGGN